MRNATKIPLQDCDEQHAYYFSFHFNYKGQYYRLYDSPILTYLSISSTFYFWLGFWKEDNAYRRLLPFQLWYLIRLQKIKLKWLHSLWYWLLGISYWWITGIWVAYRIAWRTVIQKCSGVFCLTSLYFFSLLFEDSLRCV